MVPPVREKRKPNFLTRLMSGPSLRDDGIEKSAQQAGTTRVAIPGHFLHWLGISPEALAGAAKDRFALESYSESNQFHRQASNKLCLSRESFSRQIEDTVNYALCVENECMVHQLGDEHANARNRWIDKLYPRFVATFNHFQEQDIRRVLLVQGYEPTNAIARIAAQCLHLPFLALENTAISNRMLWDNVSGITTNRNLAKNYFWRHQHEVAAATADDYCERLIAKTRQLKSEEHTSPDASGQLGSNRPYVLFLGQVLTDSSVLFGLRDWKSPIECMRQCQKWCHENGYQLIIKLHPKENIGEDPIHCRSYNQLTHRMIHADSELTSLLKQHDAIVDADNRFDTYQLIHDSSIAVTLNSQSGLEAAIRNRPVVVCGNAFYSDLGLTLDAPAPEFLNHRLQQAKQIAQSRSSQQLTEQTRIARSFAYIFFEKYCRAKTPESLLQLIEEMAP